MSSILVCDRCGEKIKMEGSWRIKTKKIRLELRQRGYPFAEDDYDLCPECGERVLAFVNGAPDEVLE